MILKRLKLLATKIYNANGRAGLSIITSASKLLKKVAPGLHRSAYNIAMRNPALARKITLGVSASLIPVLIGSVGLWAWLKTRRRDDDTEVSNRDMFIREATEATTEFATGEMTVVSANVRAALMRLNNVSSRSTDIEVFALCDEVNTEFIKYLLGVTDPKVAEFASRNLLERLVMFRQGLTYESLGRSAQVELYQSYETDPTPMTEEEIIIALEAVGRANTRLILDMYE